jgi:hypothetical protein
MTSFNPKSLATIKLKPVLNFAVQKWWLVYGLSLAIFLLWVLIWPFLFGAGAPKPTDDLVFYPQISLRETVNRLVIIPILIFVLGIILYALQKKSLIPAIVLAIITVVSAILFLAWIGPYSLRMSAGLEPDPTLTHVDSVRASDHVYKLATHKAFYEAIGKAYVFYECDSLGNSCRAIYRYKPGTLDDAYASIDNTAFISLNETNIAVHIAGKVVYTTPILTG